MHSSACHADPTQQQWSSQDGVGVGGDDAMVSRIQQKSPFSSEQISFPVQQIRARHSTSSALHKSFVQRVRHAQSIHTRTQTHCVRWTGAPLRPPPALRTIPTCGIAEELASELRSWEVYLERAPRFPHPEWSHVAGLQRERGLLRVPRARMGARRMDVGRLSDSVGGPVLQS